MTYINVRTADPYGRRHLATAGAAHFTANFTANPNRRRMSNLRMVLVLE